MTSMLASPSPSARYESTAGIRFIGEEVYITELGEAVREGVQVLQWQRDHRVHEEDGEDHRQLRQAAHLRRRARIRRAQWPGNDEQNAQDDEHVRRAGDGGDVALDAIERVPDEVADARDAQDADADERQPIAWRHGARPGVAALVVAPGNIADAQANGEHAGVEQRMPGREERLQLRIVDVRVGVGERADERPHPDEQHQPVEAQAAARAIILARADAVGEGSAMVAMGTRLL